MGALGLSGALVDWPDINSSSISGPLRLGLDIELASVPGFSFLFDEYITHIAPSVARSGLSILRARGEQLMDLYSADRIDAMILIPPAKNFQSLHIFGGLPGSTDAAANMRWANSPTGQKSWNAYFTHFDFKPFFMGSFDRQYGQFASRFVDNPLSDLNDEWRVACRSGALAWMQGAGLNAVIVETVEHMRDLFLSGEVHLTAPLPHAHNLALDIPRGESVYFVNNFSRYTYIVSLFIRNRTWSSLSPFQQDTFDRSARSFSDSLEAQMATVEAQSLRKIDQAFRVYRYDPPERYKSLMLSYSRVTAKKLAQFDPASKKIDIAASYTSSVKFDSKNDPSVNLVLI